eukprot:gnl/Chilomastix_cuspidata/1065.p1 GENE.gnl/Chilomastix_cuspidata/1065~~gnl/Chilomastix_cuspidata/1065.p1  ORF type:complete len:877 (+),score=68.73 gnl/Chilomastix_cuspidata/1065:321-2633(+)
MLVSAGSAKREERDAAAQAFGAAGSAGSAAVLAAMGSAAEAPWELREGLVMALGYTGAALAQQGLSLDVHWDALAEALAGSPTGSGRDGEGSVVCHACQAVGRIAKKGETPPKRVASALKALLGHPAIEVRREAAFAISVIDSLSTEALAELVANQTNSDANLHGHCLLARLRAEAPSAGSAPNALIEFLSGMISLEREAESTSEHSYAVADALGAIAATPTFPVKDLVALTKTAITAPEPLVQDAALRVVRVFARKGSFPAEFAGVTPWAHALMFHPSLPIQAAAREVWAELQRADCEFVHFGPFQFANESLPLLRETHSFDVRETILGSLCVLLREADTPTSAHDIMTIAELSSFVAQKCIHGFTVEGMDFARPTAARLLSVLVRLLPEGSIAWNDVLSALKLALGATETAQGAIRACGALLASAHVVEENTIPLSLALGVVSPLPEVATAALANIPTLRRGMNESAWGFGSSVLSRLCLGEPDALEAFSEFSDDCQPIPPEPIQSCPALVTLAMCRPGGTRLTADIAFAAAVAALCDGSSEFLAPQFAIAAVIGALRVNAVPTTEQRALLSIFLKRVKAGGEIAGDFFAEGGDTADILAAAEGVFGSVSEAELEALGADPCPDALFARAAWVGARLLLGKNTELPTRVEFEDPWALPFLLLGSAPSFDEAVTAAGTLCMREGANALAGVDDKTSVVCFLLQRASSLSPELIQSCADIVQDEDLMDADRLVFLPFLTIPDSVLLPPPSAVSASANEGFSSDSAFAEMH